MSQTKIEEMVLKTVMDLDQEIIETDKGPFLPFNAEIILKRFAADMVKEICKTRLERYRSNGLALSIEDAAQEMGIDLGK